MSYLLHIYYLVILSLMYNITFTLILERTKRVTMKGLEDDKNIEEDWPLKDVVFVEDQKSLPIGIFIF